MAYVDGFVLVVPTKNLKAYRKLATLAAKVWKEHGALDYVECTGDDLDCEFGLPFPRLVKAGRGETVVFSWILHASKASRNRVNAKAMKDKRLADSFDPAKMPFDVKRMAWGGFKVLVKV
jgi:uncharacterized protein YbaA (DUF1428 family)